MVDRKNRTITYLDCGDETENLVGTLYNNFMKMISVAVIPVYNHTREFYPECYYLGPLWHSKQIHGK